MNASYILSIDQGTSSTKTLIVDEAGKIICKASEPLKTNHFSNGFVEQDPEEIFQNVLISVEKCLSAFKKNGSDTGKIKTCGISNQRETFVVWDKEGKPLHNAVVWQCKRSINICEELKAKGLNELVKVKTGLLIDPYFSATKLIWLYRNNEKVKLAVDKGEAFFGTIDTWLLYKFTSGKSYFTDYTNASRTLFFNLSTLKWDEELLGIFGLSKLNLPQCKPSSFMFGETDFNNLISKTISVSAMIGDSHAAAFGEGCFSKGSAKATLGTGCSILMNIGDEPKYSNNGMVTTICWSTAEKTQYALEGVIVSCGATIAWMKNELNLFSDANETAAMARAVEDNNGVYIVPAFSGLGAPHWDMSRRGEIKGLSFSSNKNHIVRAALESIPYQIKDVIVAMEQDTNISLAQLMIDGGITSNTFIVEFLKDLLQKPVVNIGVADVSGLGAAYMAGLGAGIYKSIKQLEELNTDKIVYHPSAGKNRQAAYAGWKKAVGTA